MLFFFKLYCIILNIINILIHSEIHPSAKFQYLAKIVRQIEAGEGGFAPLRKESDFSASITYGLLAFGCGLGTTAGVLTASLNPVISVASTIVGDVLSAYGQMNTASPTGNTKSYQAVMRFIKQTFISLSLDYREKNIKEDEFKQIEEKISNDEFKQIEEIIIKPILNKGLSRVRNICGDTNSWAQYTQYKAVNAT